MERTNFYLLDERWFFPFCNIRPCVFEMLGIPYTHNYSIWAQGHPYMVDFYFPGSQDFHEHMGMLDDERTGRRNVISETKTKALSMEIVGKAYTMSIGRNALQHSRR